MVTIPKGDPTLAVVDNVVGVVDIVDVDVAIE